MNLDDDNDANINEDNEGDKGNDKRMSIMVKLIDNNNFNDGNNYDNANKVIFTIQISRGV